MPTSAKAKATAKLTRKTLGPFYVQLSSVGNPDFGQDPDQPISHPREIKVACLDDASRECRRYIQQNDLGGGNWSGGQVLNLKREPVAQVSYNGRVWEPENFPANEIL